MKQKNNKQKKVLGGYPVMSVVLSTTMALFITGLLGIILIHTRRISFLIRENIQIQVYLNKNLSKEKTENILDSLIKQKFILRKNNKSQIEFISKEEAAKHFIGETDEKFWEVLDKNPLRDMYSIRVDYKYQSKEVLEAIKRRLEKIDGVFEATYAKNLTTYINKNMNKLSVILGVFSLILLITVFVLINNTIKLALYSQRFLIRSMQLVGALPSFIKKPFMIRAIYTGLISGLLSSLFILLLLDFANLKSTDIARLQSPQEVFWILILTTFFGIAIDLFSTYRSVNKYLKMSLDDLY